MIITIILIIEIIIIISRIEEETIIMEILGGETV